MISHRAASLPMCIAHARDMNISPGDHNACHPASALMHSVHDIFPHYRPVPVVHVYPSEMRQDMVALYDYIIENQITGGTFSTQFRTEMINQFELPMKYML
jgi:hypothetical protein